MGRLVRIWLNSSYSLFLTAITTQVDRQTYKQTDRHYFFPCQNVSFLAQNVYVVGDFLKGSLERRSELKWFSSSSVMLCQLKCDYQVVDNIKIVWLHRLDPQIINYFAFGVVSHRHFLKPQKQPQSISLFVWVLTDEGHWAVSTTTNAIQNRRCVLSRCSQQNTLNSLTRTLFPSVFQPRTGTSGVLRWPESGWSNWFYCHKPG